MNKSMPSYQQFLQDEQHRTAMKRGKTKKREPGHLYSTLTGGDVYFSTFYRWYEPVYRDMYRGWMQSKELIGFKKLDKPVALFWQPWYHKEYTKKSEYAEKSIYLDTSTPARTDSGIVAEIDISDEEVLEKHLRAIFNEKADYTSLYWHTDSVGVGVSADSYEMPEWIRKFITKNGYTVWDS